MAIPYLPEEIMTNIFFRLPLKTLSSVRFFNKFWFQFISSQDFAIAHLKNSKKIESLSGYKLIFNTNFNGNSLKQFSIDNPCSINLEYPVNRLGIADVLFVGSCDGLVCIVMNNKDFILWNPCTGKYNQLRSLEDYKEKLCLCFSYGFGYDESNDDYKVVALCLFVDVDFETDRENRYAVMVYNLKRDSWKRIDYRWCGIFRSSLGKFASGKVHWLLYPECSEYSEGKIVTFDVGSEVFGMVEQPIHSDGHSKMALDVLEGCICLLVNDEEVSRSDLWVMKEYGVKESWTKVVTISGVDIFGSSIRFRPYCMLQDGEILFAYIDAFAVYNPKDCSLRLTGVENSCSLPVVYVPSLISPVGTSWRRSKKKRKLVLYA